MPKKVTTKRFGQSFISHHPKASTFDTLVFFASFAYPLSGLGQAVSVFKGQTEGVSVASWLSFMLFAMLFLVYGIKHRVVPMIITNAIWIVVDGLVVVGVLLHS